MTTTIRPETDRERFTRHAHEAEAAIRARRTPAEAAGDPTPAETAREAAGMAAVEAASVATGQARTALTTALDTEYRESLARTEEGTWHVSFGGDTAPVARARLDLADAETAEGRAMVALTNTREANAYASQQRRAAAERKAAR